MQRSIGGKSTLLTALLGMILIAGAPFFFIGGPDWVSPPLFRVLWGWGHVVFFFLLFALLQCYWSLNRWQHWLVASVAVFLVSILIEFIQSHVGRQASWHDVLRNLIGAWLAIFWLQRGTLLVWLGRLVALVLLLVHLTPLYQTVSMTHYVATQLPVLSDFEHPRELRRWSGSLERSDAVVSQGAYSLQITLLPERAYPGAGFHWVQPDWRGYQAFAFDVYNPAESSLPLTVRINDRAHDRGANAYNDRFNTRLMVEPGWNYYRINLSSIEAAPHARAMDMHQIQRVIFFGPRLEQEHVLYLDHLRLE